MAAVKRPVERMEKEKKCPKCGASHSASAGCGGKKKK